ncbi:hypothetical protein EYR36_005885 [Pleurotus pulmonarius]|nr:hypothetical protein EYR36_005885 [Pleurotus pulmonarius]KAF4600597.1 hypothetical protein EYR38_005236 [Pleurotus pulmonarius]
MLDTLCLYLAAAAACVLVSVWLDSTTPNLAHIPAIGPTGRWAWYSGARRFLKDGQEMIQEGVEKYKKAVFRVPFMDRWIVIINDPGMIDDVRQAQDDELCFQTAIQEIMQTKYLLGETVYSTHYHVDFVRSSLTRILAARFDDVRDEITVAFSDNIPLTSDWTPVPALDMVRQVICRTTNRLLVGRDPDYCHLNIIFTADVARKRLQLTSYVPEILRPLLGTLLSPLPAALKITEKNLKPFILQRLQENELLGKDRPDRPNDLISWLSDVVPEADKGTINTFIERTLAVNFAAIHTTSNAFLQVLLQLATHPEYVHALREEVETIIGEEGWSKAAIGKMLKVDSFIRESVRFQGISTVSMSRVVVNPSGFTFSNGTHLPKGTFLSCAGWAVHHDASNYSNPMDFDGFRFSNMRDGEPTKHQLVNTAKAHVAFGHGRHACPGRFLASLELKTMLAHVVLTYDVKLESEGYPRSRWAGTSAIPYGGSVMFKKRQD